MNKTLFKVSSLVVVLVFACLQMQAVPSPSVVISQVYGGGGNSGAQYTHDFVELFNKGTTTVSVAGWSIQYTSATGTGNFGSATTLITPLSGSLEPGQYLLVQEATNAAVGSPLPTPDITDSTPINMSATGGKVALVNVTSPLGCNGGSTLCSPDALATIVDLVGWDGANFFEGSSAAPATSNTAADFRVLGGCTDTDNNGSDFEVKAPNPRNAASSRNLCLQGDQAPRVSGTFPAEGATNFPVSANLTVTFSEPVDATTSSFALSCSVSGNVALSVSGGPSTFSMDPAAALKHGEQCMLTVLANQVRDRDEQD